MNQTNFQALNTTLIQNLKKKIVELKESEEKFKNIFIKSADGFVIADAETKKFIEVNDQFCRYTGFSREELLQKCVLDIHPKKDLPHVLHEFALQSQGKKTLAENIPVLRKDGQIVYADINSAQIFIKRKLYLLGIFRDITERKNAEKRLLYFQKVVEESSDAIGMSTPEGKHYYQNAAFDKLFGLSVTEVEGAKGPPASIYADEKVGREVFKTIMGGNSWTGEVEMLTKGIKTPILLKAYPIKDKNRKIVGLVGVHTDITERKKVEEKIKESELKFKTIYESSHDAIMLLDQNGFFDCNQETLKMFKVKSVKKFSQMHPADLSPPRQPDGTLSYPAAMKKIKTAYQKGSNLFNWVHRRTDGTDFDADVLLSRMQLDGRVVLQATVRDISERKKTEHALKERMKELGAFYNLSKLVETPGLTLKEIGCGLVNLIPAALPYPEIVCARISNPDHRCQTKNFKKTQWCYSVKIGSYAVLEVCYFKNRSFLREEKLLLEALAERFKRIIERMKAQEKIKALETKLQDQIKQLKK